MLILEIEMWCSAFNFSLSERPILNNGTLGGRITGCRYYRPKRYLLSKETLQILQNVFIKSIQVSLDGMRETHDKEVLALADNILVFKDTNPIELSS